MTRNSREALPDVRKWSGFSPEYLGVVGRLSRISRRPSQMSRSVWKVLPDVREATRMSGSGWEALPDVRECLRGLPNVQEWLEGPPQCPGLDGRPSRMTRNSREALPDVWKWFEDRP